MKRKFVKVMFFGALSLAVSTAVTSCKAVSYTHLTLPTTPYV